MRWPVLAAFVVVAAGARVAAAQAPPTSPPGPGEPGYIAPPTVPPSSDPSVQVLRASNLPPENAAPERVAATAACMAHDPDCDWLGTLGRLERQSVERALAARGYELDPTPWDKIIGSIEIFNEDVFAERPAWLKFFNHFHVTTREAAIRDELVIHAGERWDQARAEENGRRLRDPTFSSVVVVLPVKSHTPGKVDMLVVTRDIWSLRLNTVYTFQEGELTNLGITLSENNFFGNRDVLAAGFAMDQGQIAIGPQFLDKNVAGTHLYFSAAASALFNRDELLDDGHFVSEGSQSAFTLSRPLWALATEWAAGVSFSHHYGIIRQFEGLDLRGYQDPTTMDILPWEYELHQWSANAFVQRQWGTTIKSQLTLGHTVTDQRPRPLGNFPGSAQDRIDFIRDVLPRSEVTSVPYLEYVLFTPTYQTPRNLGTYDLVEDVRTGPTLDIQLGFGVKVLGSDDNFTRPIGTASWTFPWGNDGYITPSASLTMRFQDNTSIDDVAQGSLRVVSPSWSWARLVIQTTIATRWHDTQNAYYVIGGDPGLRGFDINEFIGFRYLLNQVELRTAPVPWWVLRLGAVAFWDSGGAANALSDTTIVNDVGVGVRALVPQTSRLVFRFDLAFPVDGPAPGVPHFIAAFDSAF